jgi:hypothetical protein
MAHNAMPYVQDWFAKMPELADGGVEVMRMAILNVWLLLVALSRQRPAERPLCAKSGRTIRWLDDSGMARFRHVVLLMQRSADVGTQHSQPKPALRLEWRGHHGQNKANQRDHLANLADSVAPSTRIRFSVHTGG